ncbi:hypothetical protein VNI00_013588 [Paramarasmius palmivorus]|uniref:Uncharacterized protein n=1 Tax=Paramarasmius palmivorus TaxID=297713 RepID=A0AAW0BWB2_9AGAR
MSPVKSLQYWFDDSPEASDTLYKIHLSKLSDHSPYLHSVFNKAGPAALDEVESGISRLHYANIDHDRRVDARDLDVTGSYLRSKIPKFTSSLSPESDYNRIASALRISKPDQLDFPRLHEHAVDCFTSLFPTEPDVLATFRFDSAEDAMAIAMLNDIQKIFALTEPNQQKHQAQKPLLYYLVTQSHLDTFPGWIQPQVVEEMTQQVMTLMQRLIDQFTPLLFTPPATSHMACTDIVADRWMPLVIAPALSEGGTGKPLEELERLKNLDWEKEGVCGSCASDKRDEWTEEQRTIWKLLDGWIKEARL